MGLPMGFPIRTEVMYTLGDGVTLCRPLVAHRVGQVAVPSLFSVSGQRRVLVG